MRNRPGLKAGACLKLWHFPGFPSNPGTLRPCTAHQIWPNDNQSVNGEQYSTRTKTIQGWFYRSWELNVSSKHTGTEKLLSRKHPKWSQHFYKTFTLSPAPGQPSLPSTVSSWGQMPKDGQWPVLFSSWNIGNWSTGSRNAPFQGCLCSPSIPTAPHASHTINAVISNEGMGSFQIKNNLLFR